MGAQDIPLILAVEPGDFLVGWLGGWAPQKPCYKWNLYR